MKGIFAAYEPGSKVATENELIKKLGVSKHTVRRALSLLEEEGMLERKQGSGTYIPQKHQLNHLREIAIFVHDYLAMHDYYQGVIMSEIGQAALEIGARTCGFCDPVVQVFWRRSWQVPAFTVDGRNDAISDLHRVQHVERLVAYFAGILKD